MNYEPRTNKAFTLIELLVAIAILAMVLVFAGAIFKVCAESHRTAIANSEIMQKLRAITDQLNADFKGLIDTKGNKASFGSEQSKIDGQPVDVNSDRITFFADGDFQSTWQYPQKDGKIKTVVGNVAAIFYGLIDPNSYGSVPEPKEKILARRQTILTADPDLLNSGSLLGEYYQLSLSEWIADPSYNPDELMVRPVFNLNGLSKENLAVYMAKGVDNFTIEYAERDVAGIRWTREQKDFVPKAFKFTFTLYDSKGVIKNGRTFTHIVYLD